MSELPKDMLDEIADPDRDSDQLARVAGGGALLQSAARIRAEALVPGQYERDWAALQTADRLEAQARTTQDLMNVGAGGELENWSSSFLDTVRRPDYVAASASRDRLFLADEAKVLDTAVDAADSIQAQDSLEKMLAHQMAVLHRGIMTDSRRLDEEIDAAAVIHEDKREKANIRATRLAGAMARMSLAYQAGLLTLQRKRSGGVQRVTVTHHHQQVTVQDGGQAVVAGKVRGAGGRGNGTGGARKNGQ
jgi:hypothetical protein